MQTIAINNVQTERLSQVERVSFFQWLETVGIAAEENRLGVTAALILIQVIVAGFNVVIPPMIGASAYLMAPGIFMTFMSNSLALAQVKMKWALLGFAVSIFVNALITIYCFIQL